MYYIVLSCIVPYNSLAPPVLDLATYSLWGLQSGGVQSQATDFGHRDAITLGATVGGHTHWRHTFLGHRFWISRRTHTGAYGLGGYSLELILVYYSEMFINL